MILMLDFCPTKKKFPKSWHKGFSIECSGNAPAQLQNISISRYKMTKISLLLSVFHLRSRWQTNEGEAVCFLGVYQICCLPPTRINQPLPTVHVSCSCWHTLVASGWRKHSTVKYQTCCRFLWRVRVGGGEHVGRDRRHCGLRWYFLCFVLFPAVALWLVDFRSLFTVLSAQCQRPIGTAGNS